MFVYAALKYTAKIVLFTLCCISAVHAQSRMNIDVTTDKARYAPHEAALITLTVQSRAQESGITACVVLQTQGSQAARQCERDLSLHSGQNRFHLRLMPPSTDFRGYRMVARLSKSKTVIAEGASALDVSSDWSRYPRYGYMANYDTRTPVSQWIEALNRYHINGLLFYDVQYKHHMPAPPGGELPVQWPDVAGRGIQRDVVLGLLQQARQRHMTTMVYNASYAAYLNAFSDGSGVQLQWATWPSANVERSADTVKMFQLPKGWSTPGLVYMNQADPGWQHYLFTQMQRLFTVLPFDGWHVDTFGDAEAWDYDGRKIDFFASFPPFADAAHAFLHRPIVLNTVSGSGQEAMANSSAEFVYSELWPSDHATYESILQAADAIHTSNPGKAIVFAAYIQNAAAEKLTLAGQHEPFNLPGILLTDATIFAAGASHIELGDGDRMLSRPYFPDDLVFILNDQDRAALRDYYDFLVSYQNLLRDPSTPSDTSIAVANHSASMHADPGKIWTVARRNGNTLILHLINLTSAQGSDWRNDEGNRTMPQPRSSVRIRIDEPKLTGAGWASPDLDHGAWHALPVHRIDRDCWEITLPELRVWSMVVLQTK